MAATTPALALWDDKVTPFVEDTRNVLVVRFAHDVSDDTAPSLRHAPRSRPTISTRPYGPLTIGSRFL